LSFEPKKLKKEQMASYLREQFETKVETFAGFEKTIRDL